jgi:hypothetical protein
MAKKDLSTLNTLIGKKKFLLSDSNPCDTDFAVFGLVAQIKYNDSGVLNHYLTSKLAIFFIFLSVLLIRF